MHIAWREEVDDKAHCTNALLGPPEWSSAVPTGPFVFRTINVANSCAVPAEIALSVAIPRNEMRF